MINKGTDKVGMSELQHIVLDLYRDVERVKKAISPNGAADIVAKHNAKAKPDNQWSLAKINPNGEATLANMPDVNNDGIPDVIIRNASGSPMYVNGYTTKRSDYPETVLYYDAHPTRASRKDYPKSRFLDELYHIEDNDAYDRTEGGAAVMGNLSSQKPEWYNQAVGKYKVRPLKNRMSPFRRFQKYIIQVELERALERLGYGEGNKYKSAGPALAKLTGYYWNELVVIPVAQRMHVAEGKLEKYKKTAEFKAEADKEVTNLLEKMYNDEDTISNFEADFDVQLAGVIESLK